MNDEQPVREFQMNIFKDFTLKWWQAGIFKQEFKESQGTKG
jgi:hypothetical protein